MRVPRCVAWTLPAAMMIPGAGVVSGQSYPNKPIHIVTAQAGSGNDFAARLVAQGLTGSLGQQVVVENRTGAGGILVIEPVAKAPPDGYTLLLYNTPMWVLPFMRNVSWDPLRDFSPITLVVSSPNILVVHPSLPARSVQDLIALAKARPGELNYASGGTGSSTHLAAELFKAMAGVNIVRIAYKGSASPMSDLISGQVQLTFGIAAPVAPHVKSGRLRALAITSAEPSALFPGLPTVAASGLPGYESVSLFGMFAPAKTPATLIHRLNQEVVHVLNRAEVKEKFFNIGVEAVGNSPEQFAAMIKADMARWGKVIKDAGIRAE
ncbi:MAG: tripartite tricarboxylate transporter substrate binding protein [Betaproteobacteria bacterium]|nr:tripartite tricarboxylate transporter substrate binding protein [Betaproteobacteria bacterium]